MQILHSHYLKALEPHTLSYFVAQYVSDAARISITYKGGICYG